MGTGGQNLQEEHVAPRYWVQMAAIKRTGAGETADENRKWVMERLLCGTRGS